MSNGISINILSNVREAVRGADDVADALEDVHDVLDDMKKSSDTSTDGVSRNLRDLTRDSDTAADRMEKDFRSIAREADDTADAIKSKMRDAYKSVRKSSKDTADDVEGFGRRASSELGDSAREGAQAFTGEFSDIGDVIQEAVANLGPAGVVGAAIIGYVIATATSAVEGWNEKIADIKDSTGAMWQEAAESGRTFIDTASIQAEAYRILWDDTYRDQFKAAEEAGVKRSDLALALAEGEGEAYDRVHKQLLDAFREQADEASYASDTYKEQGEAAMIAAGEEAKAVGAVLGLLDEKAEQVEYNKKLTREAADVTATAEAQNREQIDRTARVAGERLSGLAEQYRNTDIKLRIRLQDETQAELDRIVQNVNNRRAALGVNVYGIGGRKPI